MTTIKTLQMELDRIQAAADEYITEEGHCPGCYRYRYQEAVKQMRALKESIEWLQAAKHRTRGGDEMSKHTPWPWRYKPATQNIKDPMFYKADVISMGIRIAQVAGVGEEEANANARLIAAAPEMLHALKKVTKERGMTGNADTDNLVFEAIAKAEKGTKI